MQARLMFPDRNYDLHSRLPSHSDALVQDLALATLWQAMAAGDPFVLEITRHVLLSAMGNDLATVHYRQAVLRDCLRHPAVVRELYALAVQGIEAESKIYRGASGRHPDLIVQRSIEVVRMFLGVLRKLVTLAQANSPCFASPGFTAFFNLLLTELDDHYFAQVEAQLRELAFPKGILISAGLEQGNKATNYVLRRPSAVEQPWWGRMLAAPGPAFTFTIAERDLNGAQALAELKERGLLPVANALAQSCDHILGFFKLLRTELAFYAGCLNLHDELVEMGAPVAMPVATALPAAIGEAQLHFAGLVDACLCLTLQAPPVGNDVEASGRRLLLITGANQGGKSTYLRAIGLAQLMLQSGMFVCAHDFRGSLCDGLFTHYRREEDKSLQSGKLAEELSRMSDIVDALTPHALLLCNESFAATNDREGAEIARQIVTALLESSARVVFVTHLYEFARGLYDEGTAGVLFLRAEREVNGRRTYKVVEGEPLQTSFGPDLYGKVLGLA